MTGFDEGTQTKSKLLESQRSHPVAEAEIKLYLGSLCDR